MPGRFWLGSIADKLIRMRPVPVLLARPPGMPVVDLEHPVSLKHILVVLGGSTDADRIVEPALRIGKLTGADYTLVRVVGRVSAVDCPRRSGNQAERPGEN